MKRWTVALCALLAGPALAQVDASEVGPKAKEQWHQTKEGTKDHAKEYGRQLGLSTEEEGTFSLKDAFSLNGLIKEGGRGEITIEREGLPEAVLDIRDQTVVTVDGQRVEAKELKEGMQIRAMFQLEGEETVALKVDAKSAGKGVGGAGKYDKDADPKLKDKKDWEKR
jgi:hypothetical protein